MDKLSKYLANELEDPDFYDEDVCPEHPDEYCYCAKEAEADHES